MSGIFGFINLDGRPASPENFQNMADEMAGWGPDGVGSIIKGLKIVFTTGHLPSLVVFPAKAGNQLNNAWIPACAGMTKHEDKYETINISGNAAFGHVLLVVTHDSLCKRYRNK